MRSGLTPNDVTSTTWCPYLGYFVYIYRTVWGSISLFSSFFISVNKAHLNSTKNELKKLPKYIVVRLSPWNVMTSWTHPINLHFLKFRWLTCCMHAYILSSNSMWLSNPLSLGHKRCWYKVFLTLSLFFTSPFLSLCLPSVKLWRLGDESCLCPGPEEQLQHKPAKLTWSPWASHMHYSNQSILDHPDTLDIWGLCILLAVPICFTSPVFFEFLLAFHLSGFLAFTAASLQRETGRELLRDMFPHTVKLGSPYVCLTATHYQFEVHVGHCSN